jgi:hypothetical protein
MADGRVPNRDIGTDSQREPRIRVKHRIVLHVAPRSDGDRLLVGTNDCSEPHADSMGQADVA